MKNKLNSNTKRLQEQILYYRTRAREYDDWYLRKGRYDYGKEWNRKWFSEVKQLQDALRIFNPKGDILELACGTGWWTEQLVKYSDSITAVDTSPEVLEVNEQKIKNPRVEYIKADLFKWKPKNTFDVIFFSFWISHIPPRLFLSFWHFVRSSLKPNGRVFFIDNLQSEKAIMAGKSFKQPKSMISLRQLKDRKKFNIIKIFYNPNKLREKLSRLGWKIAVKTTPNYFIYGWGRHGTV